MIPFGSLDTVSYSYSIATVIVPLAVSTQYTNVTDTQTPRDRLQLNGKKAPIPATTTAQKSLQKLKHSVNIDAKLGAKIAPD